MKRIKTKDDSARRITRTGSYTYYVTLPKEELEQLGWREKERVVIKREGARLVIEKKNKK